MKIDYNIDYGKESIPDHIKYWYDRHTRSWIVQLMDNEDNQIDEATYVYKKSEALKQVEDWEKEYNIKRS